MSQLAIPRSYAELFERYNVQPISLVRNKHLKFTLRKTNGDIFRMTGPKTVSDYRGLKNFEATLRKLAQ